MKYTIEKLDAGQLDIMWSMLQLGKLEATDQDVDNLIQTADVVRQMLIQKIGGQRKDDPKEYVNLADLGTYINLMVLDVLVLRISGRLEKMKEG